MMKGEKAPAIHKRCRKGIAAAHFSERSTSTRGSANKKGNRADILPEDAYHAFGFVIDCRKHGKSDAAENRGDKR